MYEGSAPLVATVVDLRSFLSFLVHFPWEFLQAPLYAGLADAQHWPATVLCLTATLGDVVITWAAYAIVGMGVRSKLWLQAPTVGRMASFLALGVGITVGAEALNVYGLGRWSYGDLMPLVFGIGLSPLLQWIALPPLTIWLAKRHHE